MESSVDREWGTEGFANHVANLFLVESGLLMQLVHMELKGRTRKCKLLTRSICETCRSMWILASNGQLHDCLILSRALLEKTVTCCYLMVCDEKEFDRYFLHSLQKGYRSLDREFKSQHAHLRLYFTGTIDPSEVPRLREALDTYTSKRGRPRTRWTQKSLADQIAVIEERSDTDIYMLAFPMLWIYEDASEALHATLYGTVFDHGAYIPGAWKWDESERLRHRWTSFTVLFMVSYGALHELTMMIAKANHALEVVAQSKEIGDEFATALRRALHGDESAK